MEIAGVSFPWWGEREARGWCGERWWRCRSSPWQRTRSHAQLRLSFDRREWPKRAITRPGRSKRFRLIIFLNFIYKMKRVTRKAIVTIWLISKMPQRELASRNYHVYYSGDGEVCSKWHRLIFASII